MESHEPRLLAVRAYCRQQFRVSVADEITEPGIVAILAGKPPAFPDQPENLVAWIRRKAQVSVRKHGSRHAVVVGHANCAGNSVREHEHMDDVRAAVDVVRSWGVFEMVVGLWAWEQVGGDWVLEPLDKEGEQKTAVVGA